jgi:hypothetical protein
MALENSYVTVAENCNHYSPIEDSFTCTVSETEEDACASCENCHHFKHKHCELDLFDRIQSNLTFWDITEY